MSVRKGSDIGGRVREVNEKASFALAGQGADRQTADMTDGDSSEAAVTATVEGNALRLLPTGRRVALVSPDAEAPPTAARTRARTGITL